MTLRLYRLLMKHAAPLLWLVVLVRSARGLEETSHRRERQGLATKGRPEDKVFWVHAASVGEMRSILPLVRHVLAKNPNVTCLVTTVTVTAARLVRRMNNPRIWHQYAPFDHPLWVATFMDHWTPDVAVWIESEFWPIMLEEIHERNVPLLLVNGRMSERSFARWMSFKKIIQPVLSWFNVILAQSAGDAERLSELGANNVEIAGNMKYASSPLPCNEQDLADLSAKIGDRPVVLYASTHEGEETLAASVHKDLQAKYPGLLTVVMPRHPQRGDAAANFVEKEGVVVARRSKNQPLTEKTQIYMADTLGELGLFFRVAQIAVMGNSLTKSPGGGHNPIEAAQLGCAILYGAYMWNFTEIDQALRAAHAVTVVHDENTLMTTLDRLLSKPAEREKLSRSARDFVNTQNDVLEKVIGHLREPLARVGIAV